MNENYEFREGAERPQPKIRDRGKREVEKKANMLEELKVSYEKLDDLRPNSYNPNRQSDRDFELLCRSMKEDGFTQPIVAIKEGKIIVDGEHRWRAAKKLGYTEVPVVLVDMTVEQMRISTLRHNRARGSEDLELSTAVLRDLRELGALDWAQDSLMMGDEEMRILLDDVPAPQELAGEEFSESWVPISQGSNVSTEARIGQNEIKAESEDVVEAVKKTTREVNNTSSLEEKQMIIKNMEDSIYRIAVSFTGDEAKIVKNILGNSPAVRLKELCKKYENNFEVV